MWSACRSCREPRAAGARGPGQDAEAGLDHIPVVVGGIISPEDELVLKNMGVRAVYTPKDYAIDQIMVGLAKVVERNLAPAEAPPKRDAVY